MEILFPKVNGICNGVRLALEKAESEQGDFCVYGELIHNKRELGRLGARMKTINSLQEVNGNAMLIRTHGVPMKVFAEAELLGIKVIDATCPFVKSVQQKAKNLHEMGYHVIIYGNSKHPEVIALKSWAGEDAAIVENEQDALALDLPLHSALISQTTVTAVDFAAIADIMKAKNPDLLVENTICLAVAARQMALRDLCKCVDLIIVVGDKTSSNCNKLTHICSESGVRYLFIEGADELSGSELRNVKRIGVAAGASTPQWIIEEVVVMIENQENVMQEETVTDTEPKTVVTETAAREEIVYSDDETFAEAYERGLNTVRTGARVKGVVVRVREGELLVDIGGKSEGILPSAELIRDEAENIQQRFTVGDEIEVLVIRKENKEGYPMLSKKRIDQEIAWEALAKAKDEKSIITGKITEVVKGGLLADVGVRGFIPASMLSIGFVDDLTSFVGKELPMRVIECDKHNNKLVLSPKAVMREEADRKKTETWETIAENHTVHGTVRRLTNFGAFVDIGGVDGLLHISEMAWYRVNKPSDILKEGDNIEAYVLGVDRENGKISLGLKQLIPNPWTLAAEKYPVNDIFPAKIMRTAPFGAFAELEPGIEGLVHISQISWTRLNKTEDGVRPGDIVKVKVLSLDPETKRISLSIKETEPSPEIGEAVVTEEADLK